VTTYEYSGYQTVVTDALGRHTTILTNSRRLPVKVTEPAGNIMSYAYDAGDRTIQVDIAFNDPKGLQRTSRTSHEYDSVGQRMASTDPDLGRWEYRYNAFGDLVYQKDANKQSTTLKYDSIGRPTERTAVDRTDLWQYDAARGKGVGSVKSVASSGTSVSGGYLEEYSYDNFGRQIASSAKVGSGTPFITTVEYDEYGRIKKTQAPDSFGITNTYDASGYLTDVRDTATGRMGSHSNRCAWAHHK
jgi:YD repeat-containing protein